MARFALIDAIERCYICGRSVLPLADRGLLLRQTEVANDACGRRVGVAVISVHLKVNRRLFNTVLLTQLLQGLDVGHLCELRPARIADPTLLLAGLTDGRNTLDPLGTPLPLG